MDVNLKLIIEIDCDPEDDAANFMSPAVTLFKIPSRKFVKKEKESWAERLECIVLACRSDEHIKNLFARDAVKMCEVHFERSDIVLKGSRKELREGAVPTLSLPKLTLAQVHSRKPPKKRIFETKLHFKSVASLKSARLPEGWQRSFENKNLVFSFYDGCDQPKYSIGVLYDMSLRICYYGWKAPRSSCIYSLDITTQTLHGTIKDIESFSICSGLYSSGSGLPHMTTKSMTPFSSENAPTVRKLAYRVVGFSRFVRTGSWNFNDICELVVNKHMYKPMCMSESGQCRSCCSVDEKEGRLNQKRLNYYNMVKDQPLKRSAQPTFNLPSRITSTFTANEIW
ncbi:unnamed protein product [Clavelina lepadiformis]|uniref:THAP-type domain-containing protein n=1 Tax=Clavelina lepadiformis TaxID=159417 RepID=A0ABP0FA97_CLALP